MDNSLKGKTIFITGASRGIGRAIALKCASEGANIVIAAKSDTEHAKLAGTIYSVADEIEQAGGKALPLKVDVRDEAIVTAAVDNAVATFGGIDILVNNASAISLTGIEQTEMKRFDLMQQVNARATFLCAKYCIPHLAKAANPHILTLSPPLNMNPKWFAGHLAYTLSKYGMSMCTLGLAEELKPQGIAVNSLWPKTTIATAAIEMNFPAALMQASRKPDIMADAAYAILTSNAREVTGNFFVDEALLRSKGMTDFYHYAVNPQVKLYPDFFLDEE
ncbi:MAG: NAD(P)-dependent oxidoreductase [Methylophilus sp.]|jgi:citronellol/citronellal dehydrogenase